MIREDYEKLYDNKFDSLVGEIPGELTSLQRSLNEKWITRTLYIYLIK